MRWTKIECIWSRRAVQSNLTRRELFSRFVSMVPSKPLDPRLAPAWVGQVEQLRVLQPEEGLTLLYCLLWSAVLSHPFMWKGLCVPCLGAAFSQAKGRLYKMPYGGKLEQRMCLEEKQVFFGDNMRSQWWRKSRAIPAALWVTIPVMRTASSRHYAAYCQEAQHQALGVTGGSEGNNLALKSTINGAFCTHQCFSRWS